MFRQLLLSCVLLVPATVLVAQSRPAPPKWPGLSGQIGTGVVSTPAYPGASERIVFPFPILDLQIGQRIYVGGTPGGMSMGTGVVVLASRRVTWTVDAAVAANRPESRADALKGMGDRGLGVFGGSTLAYRVGPVQASASVAQGVEQRMGATAILGLTGSGGLGGRFFGSVGGYTVFATSRNTAWDFAVTPAQASRRAELLARGADGLRPQDAVPFAPEGGRREVRGLATLGFALSSRLSIVGMGAASRLEGDARTSPLVRKKQSWEGGLGLAWRL